MFLKNCAQACVAVLALGLAWLAGTSRALAASETWTGASSSLWNASGNWTGTNLPPVAGDTLIFGSSSVRNLTNDYAAGTSFGGISFSTGAGAYTLGGNNIALTGALTVNSAGGTVQTVNVGIAGTSASSLVFGSDASGGNAVTLNANSTFGAINVGSNSSTANTLNIGAGTTVQVNGVLTYTGGTAATNASLAVNGAGGTLSFTDSTAGLNFTVGSDNAAQETASLNLSGLSNFSFTSTNTGNFTVGYDGKLTSTLTLASGSNAITAPTFSVGDSNGKNGATSAVNFNGATAINANTFTFGASKGTGNAAFVAGSPVGSAAGPALLIRAQNGTGRAAMTVGTGSSGSGSGNGTLNLSGHYVDALLSTLTLGNHTGNIAAGNAGTLTFDDGVIDATTILLANCTQVTGSATGTLTVGSANNANVGTLIVGTGGLTLGKNTASGSTATATLDIKQGGVVQVSSDIVKGTATGTVSSSLILEGGTLDLGGHNIGSAASQINTVTLTNGTIRNLGAGGINGGGVAYGGAGTLTLAGANTYAGDTTVNGGTVSVTGSTLATGNVVVNGGALAGTGSAGNVTLNAGPGAIRPGASGADGSTGTLSLATFTGNGGDLRFDLAGAGSADQISVAGNATFANATTIHVSPVNLTSGTYPVLVAGSLNGAQANLSLPQTVVGRSTLQLDYSVANTVNLIVQGSPANLVWVGGDAGGANWDGQTTQNFNNTSSGLNPDVFYDGDNVTFDGTSANRAVNVNGTVQPGAISVTAAGYSIGGGVIGGAGGVTVSNGGSLSLTGNGNTYTGTTTIGQGSTLTVSTLAATGSPSSVGQGATNIVIDGGTLSWTGVGQTTNRGITVTQNGATIDATPSGTNSGNTISGPFAMTGSGARTLTLTGTDATLSTNAITSIIADGAGGATSLVKSGSGNWQLSGANTYSGGTDVQAGRLRITGAGALGGGAVSVESGGQLYMMVASTFPNPITIAGTGVDANGAIRAGTSGLNLTGTITLAADSRITGVGATTGSTISGRITGPFNLQLNNGSNTGILTLSNTGNSWTGNTTIGAPTLRIGASSNAAAGVIPHGAGYGDVTLNGSSATVATVVDLNGQGLIINGLNSTGTLGQISVTNNSTTANATLTVGDNDRGGSYGGAINDGSKTVAFAKMGSGTQVLSGSNNYSGGTTVNGGVLQAGSGSAFGNSGNAPLAINAGTLDLNGNSFTFGDLSGTAGTITSSAGPATVNVGTTNSTTFSGTIANGGGAVSLTKQGSGTLTLAGAHTYSGNTTVNNGTLNVTGSLLSAGNVQVNSGTLAGTGHVGNVNNSGTISPGASANGVGTLGLSSLNVNFGGNIAIDVNAGADQVAVTGAAAFNGDSTITVQSAMVNVPTGSYPIVTAGSLNVATPPTLVNPLSRQRFSLDYSTPNTITLNVSGAAIGNVTWNNAGGTGDGTTWDIVGQQNWHGPNPDQFYPVDNVTFNDANNGHYAVDLESSVTPSGVTVDTANTYAISGGGTIDGTGSLTKTGAGTLSLGLTGASTFTGGTFVQNGTLQFAANNVLPAGGAVTLGDAGNHAGILDLNGNNFASGNVSVVGTGASVITNNGSNDSTITSNASSAIAAVIADGATNKINVTSHAGTLTLSGNNTYTGATTIDSGATLQIGAGGATGSISPASGISDNGTLAFNRSDTVTFTSAIGGSGSLLQAGTGTVILTASNSYANTTISAGSTLQVGNGGTTGTLGSGTVTANGTLVFDRGDDQTFSTVIGGSGGIQVIGQSALTLSGASTYTGNTLIGPGATVKPTVATAFGSVTSAGVVTVNGGTIDITNFAANSFAAKLFQISGSGVNNQGALLTNAGTNQTTAFAKVTLTGDATVGIGTTAVNSRFDLRNNGATLDLGGHTLTKIGAGQLTLVAGTLTGGGTLDVQQGVFSFQTTSATSGTGTVVYETGANAEFYQTAANRFNWNMVFKGNNLLGSANGTTANVNGNVTLQGNISVGPTNGFAGAAGASNFPLALLGNISESGGSFGITKFGVATVTLGGTNAYTGGTTVNDAGTLALTKAFALGVGPLTINAGSVTTTANFANAMHVTSLSIASAAKMEMNNNDLIVDYAPGQGDATAAAVASYLTGGYAGGAWNGTTGLVSSAAAGDATKLTTLGYVDAGLVGMTSDGGVSITGNAVVVKYTYYGDTDLNGYVDANDLANLLAGMSGGLTGWVNGDLNYDGTVNSVDLDILLNALANQGAPLGSNGGNGGAGTVPEPSATVIFVGLAALVARRRAR